MSLNASHAMAGSSNRELFSIQSLRGIAAVVVLVNHTQLWQLKYFKNAALLPSWFSVGEVGVDLFFLISGFILMYVTPRAFKGWRDQLIFLVRRLFRIYPVYWAIALPLLIIWCVNPKLMGNNQGNKVDIISSLFLTPSALLPVLVVAWSLIYEIYFYVIASFIFYWAGGRRMVLVAIWFAVIAISNFLHPQLFGSSWLNVWLSPLALEFIFGMALAYTLPFVRVRISSRFAFCVLMVALFCIFFFGSIHGRFLVNQREPIRLAIYGLPAFAIVGVIVQMEIQQQWSWIKQIVWLGDRSYSIYLLHVPVIASLLMVASKFTAHSGGLRVLGLTLLVVCFILIPVEFFYQLIEKPCHAFAKHLAVRLKFSEKASKHL